MDILGYGIGVVTLCIIFIHFVSLALITMFYRKAKQGQALVRDGLGGLMVSFTGMLAFPRMHVLEIVDISMKKILVEKTGDNALVFRDGTRIDIRVDFFIRINRTREDVSKVAQSLGCETASDPGKLNELFTGLFDQKLREFADLFDFKDIFKSNEQFKEEIIEHIGVDLNGFILDDMAFRIKDNSPEGGG